MRTSQQEKTVTIKIHDHEQGTPEWYAARCGILTASEMKHILTPKFTLADNEKTRMHVWELLSQRITGFVEPTFCGFDMQRGKEDEVIARDLYSATYAPVVEAGFITNDKWGFTIGCSPDGLVGKNGGVEFKSRKQKYQIQTIVENVANDTIPAEFMLQVQTCLLVTERKWWEFGSFSGGLHMPIVRVFPDEAIQEAIVKAATLFEEKVEAFRAQYDAVMASDARLIPTERREYSDGDDIVADPE